MKQRLINELSEKSYSYPSEEYKRKFGRKELGRNGEDILIVKVFSHLSFPLAYG